MTESQGNAFLLNGSIYGKRGEGYRAADDYRRLAKFWATPFKFEDNLYLRIS